MKIPHDPVAEEMVLAGLFAHPELVEVVGTVITTEDFYIPRNQQMFSAIEADVRHNRKPSRTSLHEAGIDPKFLESLFTSDRRPFLGEARHAADRIADLALRRRVMGLAMAALDEARDETQDLHALVDRVRSDAQGLELTIGHRDPSPDLPTFMATHEDPVAWVIPDLVARQERLIVTGSEGLGKSTLLRQLAFLASVGVHPFTSRPWSLAIPPAKVLVVDLENTRRQIQDGFGPMATAARVRGQGDGTNLHIEVRPEGLDLVTRTDAVWLTEVVQANEPDVLFIGPLYRMQQGNPNDEEQARRVANVIDRLRARYGIAVVIEAHSPWGGDGKRPGRPFGSSLWARWPEFGYTLRPEITDETIINFEAWRGPRSTRAWPNALRRGGLWPWTVVDTNDI